MGGATGLVSLSRCSLLQSDFKVMGQSSDERLGTCPCGVRTWFEEALGFGLPTGLSDPTCLVLLLYIWGFPKIEVPLNHPLEFSMINHPFWGIRISGNHYLGWPQLRS